MRIYNTLSRSVEEFSPINLPNIGIYSCGPTVYDFQHIGHMRRYVGDDLLIRVLRFNDFNVHHVMNITDVGHLVSDADSGEDKMEKGAKKFGLSVWDIAKKFEKQFTESCALLNIDLPKELMHATDYIQEQINLIKKLEEKGFTYKTNDGIYFETSRFPDYFKLSLQNPNELLGGARVDLGEKKSISDFALWKFSYEGGVTRDEFEKSRPTEAKSMAGRQMEWESPWGIGFPGWHIECSAMSMKALGESFDIHTGGIDHINIHHTNEIAQAEAVTEKQFVKYWVHHAFLTVEGEKMSKSIGNIFTVQDVIDKGYDPMSLRYLYLQTHYRQEMNFTWEALEAAQTALQKMRRKYNDSKNEGLNLPDSFNESINEDLNFPKALAVVWENIDKLSKNDFEKIDSIFGLGLDLETYKKEDVEVSSEVQILIERREEFRKSGNYEEADKIRDIISEKGFRIEDSSEGLKIVKI